MDSSALIETLGPPERLALAYAAARLREPTLAVLALDARLAGIVRRTREPMLGQIKLAWWRERLREPVSAWPGGEPLLQALRPLSDHRHTLAAVVDGWESLIGDPPLHAEAIARAGSGRAQGFVALAQLAGARPSAGVETAATQWAAADLALHFGDPQEAGAARAVALSGTAATPALPRAMRPLAVLRGLALRRLRRGGSGEPSATDALAAIRLGIFGR